MDSSTTLDTLKEKLKNFTREREWEKYHTPKNLSMKISIEAAELMEIFVWLDNPESFKEVESRREEIENEVADVASTLLLFCIVAHIDLSKAIERKIAINAERYPIDKAKGKALKYTKL